MRQTTDFLIPNTWGDYCHRPGRLASGSPGATITTAPADWLLAALGRLLPPPPADWLLATLGRLLPPSRLIGFWQPWGDYCHRPSQLASGSPGATIATSTRPMPQNCMQSTHHNVSVPFIFGQDIQDFCTCLCTNL